MQDTVSKISKFKTTSNNEMHNQLVRNLGLDNSRIIAHDSYSRSGPLVKLCLGRRQNSKYKKIGECCIVLLNHLYKPIKNESFEWFLHEAQCSVTRTYPVS